MARPPCGPKSDAGPFGQVCLFDVDVHSSSLCLMILVPHHDLSIASLRLLLRFVSCGPQAEGSRLLWPPMVVILASVHTLGYINAASRIAFQLSSLSTYSTQSLKEQKPIASSTFSATHRRRHFHLHKSHESDRAVANLTFAAIQIIQGNGHHTTTQQALQAGAASSNTRLHPSQTAVTGAHCCTSERDVTDMVVKWEQFSQHNGER